jgi:hypothetical protein
MGCGSSGLTNDNNLIRNRHISNRNANNNRKPVSNTVYYIVVVDIFEAFDFETFREYYLSESRVIQRPEESRKFF